VLTLRHGVTFSDGSAVTPADVAFTIQRNLDPADASSYGYAFSNVAGVKVTGPSQVTIDLKRPDETIESSLATLAGAIVKKSFVLSAGKGFGSPKVGVDCTGPYEMQSYDGTSKLVMVRNPHYWDKAHAAKTSTFTFVFPADPSALANGLASGAIDGAMDVPSSLIATLKSAKDGRLFIGDAGSTPVNIDILMTRTTGVLANVKVRQALSDALDRSAIAQKIFLGAADPLYRVSGPGMWGYARSTFAADYAKLPTSPDLAKAKQLVTESGVTGSATFAYPAGDPQSEQLATVLQQTASSIGIDLKIQALPAQQYGSLFSDPSMRSKYDAILTKNYVEHPDPVAMDRLYGGTGGGTNFSGYSNSVVDKALLAATQASDPTTRANDVLTAEHQLDQDLPSIPVVGERAVVFQNSAITGAPLTFAYMTSAWAARIGAK
jgi:peptide/nickel transport system substrate-binding protein